MTPNWKRPRSSAACTMCRQMKTKCDRKARQPNRCSRCEAANTVCETDPAFQRRRIKSHSHEIEELRQELERLRSQVPLTTASAAQVDTSATTTTSHASIGKSAHTLAPKPSSTLPRSVGDITILPWQVDRAFETFFREMHPFLPFLVQSEPNTFYVREPFLFWTICLLGLRSVQADLSKALSDHVNSEALRAAARSCNNQSAATSVVQALLLLAIWPFNSQSVLSEHAWLHCGSATHLAFQIGLHEPYAASEFVPENRRKDISTLFEEFRRTWIACYIVNSIVSFVRGFPNTIHSDHNINKYTLSNAAELSIPVDLFKMMLIIHRIEAGHDAGNPRTTWDGHVEAASREGVYNLLSSRLFETVVQVSPISPYLQMLFNAAKLQSYLQVLQRTSPLTLQETVIPAAVATSTEMIDLARSIQTTTNMVHLPAFVDTLVLTATLLIFKILISRFASLANEQHAQKQIAEACSYYREGVNEFNDIPRRVQPFLEALYQMVLDGHLPLGGFIIENVRYRRSQNILYEVLWAFHEWKRQRAEIAEGVQYLTTTSNAVSLSSYASLENNYFDDTIWQMLDYQGIGVNYGSLPGI